MTPPEIFNAIMAYGAAAPTIGLLLGLLCVPFLGAVWVIRKLGAVIEEERRKEERRGF